MFNLFALVLDVSGRFTEVVALLIDFNQTFDGKTCSAKVKFIVPGLGDFGAGLTTSLQ